MKNSGVSAGKAWKHLLLLGLGGLCALWIYSLIREGAQRDLFIAVSLDGVQHIGPGFSIAPFYLNGINGFNVNREGGGGSSVCCVLLPKQWRPDLSVDLRWAVANWTKENRAEIALDNYKSITFERYRAKVPVEKYDTPGKVVAHFFADGKARVVVGWPRPPELDEEFLPASAHASKIATIGQNVKSLFTEKELNAMRSREEAHQNKHGGEWK